MEKKDFDDLNKSVFIGDSFSSAHFSNSGDEGYYASVDKTGNVISVPLNSIGSSRMNYEDIRKEVLKKR